MPEWVIQMGYVLLVMLGAAIVAPLAVFSVQLTWVMIRAWRDMHREEKRR